MNDGEIESIKKLLSRICPGDEEAWLHSYNYHLDGIPVELDPNLVGSYLVWMLDKQ